MRHAAVAYFVDGRPVRPDVVSLTPEGVEQARAAAAALAGAKLDRVIPAVERLLADPGWDVALLVLHGGVNRAILSYALTRGRLYLGNFEQAPACVNVLDVGDDWIVRAVNVTPYDPVHLRGRATTMEELWAEFKNM